MSDDKTNAKRVDWGKFFDSMSGLIGEYPHSLPLVENFWNTLRASADSTDSQKKLSEQHQKMQSILHAAKHEHGGAARDRAMAHHDEIQRSAVQPAAERDEEVR